MALNGQPLVLLNQSQRHREIAKALLQSHNSLGMTPAPKEWAIVAAHSAAALLIDAFLLEQKRRAPSSPTTQNIPPADDNMRMAEIQSWFGSGVVSTNYRHLSVTAADIRFGDGSAYNVATITASVGSQLAQIEGVVYNHRDVVEPQPAPF